MRAIVISDTHNQHKQISLPRGEILIHCGDFTKSGSRDEVRDFARWLGKQDHEHKLVIPGNHDEWTYLFQADAKALFAAHGARMLIEEYVEVEGLRIFATPWTPSIGRMSWQYGRNRSKLYWDQHNTEVDILVTHGPPHGILDYVPGKGRHAGCMSLLNKVYEQSPRYHVFGHIHEGYGRVKSDEIPTKFINASSWNHHEMSINKPQVLDL